MQGLTIENTKDKIIFSIDRNSFTEDVLLKMIKIARLEFLIKEANFDESVVEIGEEIKKDWWNEHKDEILKRIGKC